MRTWQEIAASPEYQQAEDSDRERLRNDYWDNELAPIVPDENRIEARQIFDQHTAERGNPDQGYGWDVVDAAQQGMYSGSADLVSGAEQLVGGDGDNGLTRWLRGKADQQLDEMSPDGRRAMEGFGIEEDANSATGYGFKDSGTWAGFGLQFASGLGSLAPSMIPGGAVARGVSYGMKGKKAFDLATRAKAVKNVNDARRLGKLEKNIDRASQFAGYGATGAAMIGAGGAEQAKQAVLQAGYDDLAESPRFQELYKQEYDAAGSEDTTIAFNQAKALLAEEARESAFGKSAAVGLMSMGIAGPMLDKVIRGVGGSSSRIVNGAKGGAIEGAQEFSEGAGQQIASNVAQGDLGMDVGTFDGAMEQGLSGAMVGAAVGKGVGMLPRAHNTTAAKTQLHEKLNALHGQRHNLEAQLQNQSVDPIQLQEQIRQNALAIGGVEQLLDQMGGSTPADQVEAASEQARQAAKDQGGDALDQAQAASTAAGSAMNQFDLDQYLQNTAQPFEPVPQLTTDNAIYANPVGPAQTGDATFTGAGFEQQTEQPPLRADVQPEQSEPLGLTYQPQPMYADQQGSIATDPEQLHTSAVRRQHPANPDNTYTGNKEQDQQTYKGRISGLNQVLKQFNWKPQDKAAKQKLSRVIHERKKLEKKGSAKLQDDDSLIVAIGKLGGLNAASVEDTVAESLDAHIKANRIGLKSRYLKKTKGYTLDDMTRRLAEVGYTKNGQEMTAHDLSDAIEQEVSGRPVFSERADYEGMYSQPELAAVSGSSNRTAPAIRSAQRGEVLTGEQRNEMARTLESAEVDPHFDRPSHLTQQEAEIDQQRADNAVTHDWYDRFEPVALDYAEEVTGLEADTFTDADWQAINDALMLEDAAAHEQELNSGQEQREQRERADDQRQAGQSVRQSLEGVGKENRQESPEGQTGQRGSDADPQEETPPLELTTQTEQQRADQEARQKEQQAKEQRQQEQAEQKAKADSELNDFGLTGSDSASDANPAQNDLLSGTPQTSSKQESEKATSEKFEDFGEELGGARKDEAERGFTRSGTTKTKEQKQQGKKPSYYRYYTIGQQVTEGTDKGKWVLRRDSSKKKSPWSARRVGSFDTEQEAKDAIPISEVSVKHRVREHPKDSGQWEIYRRVTDRKKFPVKKGFASERDAMTYMVKNPDEIISFKTALGDEIRPNLEEVDRRGKEHRKGHVTPKDFQDTFGFYAGQFGNWNTSGDRQADLDYAYDALMDLAEILNLPPKALSLNGELAVAFGARGRGLSSATAHYERSFGVINLTKMKGAGSLAHEWMHALDHYFGRQDGKADAGTDYAGKGARFDASNDRKNDYVSHGFRYSSKVRDEAREQWQTLLDTLFTTTEEYIEDGKQYERKLNTRNNSVTVTLDNIKAALEKDYSNDTYKKRHKKPATKEQLQQFDKIARRINKAISSGKIIPLAFGELKTGGRSNHGKKNGYTSDDLNALSALLKKVRGSAHWGDHGYLTGLSQQIYWRNNSLDKINEIAQQQKKTRKRPTDYVGNSYLIDEGRTGEYWGTNHELLARAFEGYIFDRIHDKGLASDYLAFGVTNDYYEFYGVKPYPEGQERKRFSEAFDNLFKTLKHRKTDKGIQLYRLRDSKAKGLKQGPVQLMLRPLEKKLGIPVQVIQSETSLPTKIYQGVMQDGAQGRVRGVYDPDTNTAFVIADNLDSKDEALRTVLHEVVGHQGLHALTGNRLGKVLDTVYRDMSSQQAAQLRQRYSSQLEGQSEQQQERIIAEEYIAHLAERDPENTLLNKVVAILRNAMRRIFPNLRWTKSDLVELIASSRKALKDFSHDKPAEAGERYSLNDDAESEGVKFRERLVKTINSKKTYVHPILVGQTPEILQKLGAADLPVTIQRDVVRKATNRVKHKVPMAVIEQLPELLGDPELVFSGNVDDSFSVVVKAFEEGKPVMVAMHMNVTEQNLSVNKIASVYGRPKEQYRNWIKKGKLKYTKNEESLRLVRLSSVQFQGVVHQLEGHGGKIATAKSLVKRKADKVDSKPNKNLRYSLDDDTDNHHYLFESTDGFTLERKGDQWTDGKRTYDADKDGWPRDDYGNTLTGKLKPKRIDKKQLRYSLDAYHGSSDNFDEFSADNIGKGEGAQVYGWGLYFAGKKEVADFYKEKLQKSSLSINGKPMPNNSGGSVNIDAVIQFIRDNYDLEGFKIDGRWVGDYVVEDQIGIAISQQRTRDKVLEYFDRKIKTYKRDNMPKAVEEAKKIKDIFAGMNIQLEKKETGAGYEVELAPNLEDMLHWDEAFSDQPEAVYQALKDTSLYRQTQFMEDGEELTGEQIYREYESLEGSDQEASEFLAELGIPGIAYLDGFSREKGEGSYNYVIFDDKDVTIKNRYSLKSDLPNDVESVIDAIHGNTSRKKWTDKVKDWLKQHPIGSKKGWYQGTLDSFHSIEVMEKEKNGGTLLEGVTSAYKAALRTKNLDGVMTAILGKGAPTLVNGSVTLKSGSKGFLEIFEPIAEQNEMELWEVWAGSKRAMRLMKEGRENLYTPERIATIQNYVRTMPGMEQRFQKVFDDYQTFNSQVLDFAQQAGLIDGEARKLWDNGDYIPFHRVHEVAEGIQESVFSKSGLSGQKSGIKNLTGGVEKISPLEAMYRNTQSLIDASFKNIAMQRIADIGVETGAMDKTGGTNRLTDDDVTAKLKEMNVDTNLTPEQMKRWKALLSKFTDLGDGTVTVSREGKSESYQVNDPLLLASITDLGPQSYHWLLKLLSIPKRMLTALVTADPGFMARNLFRDTLSTWMTVHPTINGKALKVNPVSAAIRTFNKKIDNDDSRWALMMAGGGSGGFYDIQPENVRQKLSPSDAQRVINKPGELWNAWQKFGSRFENANRLHVYEKVLAQGGSVAEAAHQAQDVLNFTRKGQWQIMNLLINSLPFFNARVQGLNRLYRGAKAEGKNGWLAMAPSFLIRGSIYMGASMALLSMYEDDERYIELPDWDKQTYHHFWTEDGTHLRIPKPFEVGALFGTLPEMIWQTSTGKEDMKWFRKMAGSMIFNTLSFDPVPQAFRPAMDIAKNENGFTEAPIIPLGLQYVKPEAQYDPWTSETMKQLVKAVPESAPDWMRSPKKLQYLLQGYFGTLGRYALNGADILTRSSVDAAVRPESRIRDLPVAGSFVRDGVGATRYSSEMYEMRAELGDLMSTIKRYRESGQTDQARNMMEENKEKLKTRKAVNRYARRISVLRKRVRTIMDSKAMTATVKRRRIDQLNQQINRLSEEVVRKYRKPFR